MFFVFSLEQKVAGHLSNAFVGCSGLGSILQGLEGRDAPTQKPMALKRKVLCKVGAKKKPAAAPCYVAPVPKAAPGPNADPVIVIGDSDEDAPVLLAAPAEPRVLSTSRKCCTSRAYRAAEKVAKAAGLSAAEVSKAAQEAYKKESEKWDLEHA